MALSRDEEVCSWKYNGNPTHAWDSQEVVGRTYGGEKYHRICTGSTNLYDRHGVCGRTGIEESVRKSKLGDDVPMCARCVRE